MVETIPKAGGAQVRRNGLEALTVLRLPVLAVGKEIVVICEGNRDIHSD